jgi:7-cyano-7-deazaguanine synthase
MRMHKAVVVFSGGQDSTTCLAWALRRFYSVAALTFDYGQRHAAEIQAAAKICEQLNVPHEIVDLRGFGRCSPSALTNRNIDVSSNGGLGGLPSTFTPGRNLVFLTTAASYAITRGAETLVTGVCQTDYSGYPDCRRDTIDALQRAIALGNGLESFSILTPLMFLSKRETVELARDLAALPLLAHSLTCYLGQRPACGKCPACLLRLKGFAEAGIRDPLPYADDVPPVVAG